MPLFLVGLKINVTTVISAREPGTRRVRETVVSERGPAFRRVARRPRRCRRAQPRRGQFGQSGAAGGRRPRTRCPSRWRATRERYRAYAPACLAASSAKNGPAIHITRGQHSPTRPETSSGGQAGGSASPLPDRSVWAVRQRRPSRSRAASCPPSRVALGAVTLYDKYNFTGTHWGRKPRSESALGTVGPRPRHRSRVRGTDPKAGSTDSSGEASSESPWSNRRLRPPFRTRVRRCSYT